MAVKAGFLALDAVVAFVEELDELDGFIDGIEAFFGEFGGFIDLEVDSRGFDGAGAGKAEFDAVLGLAAGDEIDEILGGVFFVKKNGLGVNAVFDGIFAGTEFAEVGFGKQALSSFSGVWLGGWGSEGGK